jgi:hypothetical protein
VLPFKLASYLFGSLSVAPRETVYHLYELAQTERNVSRELVEIRANIGTTVSRVFAVEGETLKGIKHVVEPELSYLFVPGSKQAQIPVMDFVDRVNRRNVFTFAIANRFLGKFNTTLGAGSNDPNIEALNPVDSGDVRQLGSLRLALGYDINQARKGSDSLTDLDFQLRFTPLTYFAFGFDGGLNPGPWQVTQARASFGIIDPRPLRRVLDPDFSRPNSVSMSYKYMRQGPNGLLEENANINLDVPATDAYCGLPPPPPLKHGTDQGPGWDPRCTGFNKPVIGQIAGDLVYHLHDQVMVSFTATYDVRDNRFPGYHTFVKYLSSCECWAATLSYRHEINPAKNSFSFDFNLLGLGAQRNTLK